MNITRRRHAATIAVAMVTAVVTANAPAIAHGVHALFAHNADKVDGLHAVKSTATKKKRRGKLVATSPKTGRLPNNIIKKAPNANRLDGFDSLDFLKVGETAANADLLDGMDSDEFLQADAKAADSDLLDGMNSDQFLQAGAKAADSDLLDGMDSSAFLQAGDPIDADTLEGKGAEDFVARSGNGIWLVQGDVSAWRSKVGAGSMTSSPDFDETTFTSGTTSGNATHFIVPDLPLAAYGRSLEMAGIEICYDASSGHFVDRIQLARTTNTGGIPATSFETLDGTDRADEACWFDVPADTSLTPTETVALSVDSVWTASSSSLRLGRVTFMLAPGDADAAPLD